MSIKNSKNKSIPKCSEGKYWIRSHQRKRVKKDGKTYIQHVKGYCSTYHGPFHKLAEEEKMSLDHLYYALTVYGEARSENEASMRAIAWIIKNRFNKAGKKSYQQVVLRKTQFSCWLKSDKNYQKLIHPGKNGYSSDKKSWLQIKKIVEEVYSAPKNQNPVPGVYCYFSGKPKKNYQHNYFNIPGIPNFHFVKPK